MSGNIIAIIAEMEDYLKETELLDPDFIAEWNLRFTAAVEVTERDDAWPGIVARAHALGETIQKRIGGLNYEREQIRAELSLQVSGQRALKGYSSGTR